MPDPIDVHVTLAEIARIAGVGRAAVSNWRRRHDTFPAPVGGSDTSPQFSLSEVEQWLRHNGKVEGAGSREHLWPRFEALGDRTSAGLAIAEIARRVLAGDMAMPGPEGGDLPEDARRLVERVVEGAGRADGQAIFEFLLARWLDTHVRQISVTPAPLAGPDGCYRGRVFPQIRGTGICPGSRVRGWRAADCRRAAVGYPGADVRLCSCGY